MSIKGNLLIIADKFRRGQDEEALKLLATLPNWIEYRVRNAFEDEGSDTAVEVIRVIMNNL